MSPHSHLALIALLSAISTSAGFLAPTICSKSRHNILSQRAWDSSTTNSKSTYYYKSSQLAFVFQSKSSQWSSQKRQNQRILSALLAQEDDDDEKEEYFLEEEDGEEYEEEEYEDEEYYEAEEGDDLYEYVPLEDDGSDPNYTAQVKAIEESIATRDSLKAVGQVLNGEGEESSDFLRNTVESFLDENVSDDDATFEKTMKKFQLTKKEVDEMEQKIEAGGDDIVYNDGDLSPEMMEELGIDADVFPSDDDPVMLDLNLRNEDLVNLQNSIKDLVGSIEGLNDGSLVDNKQAMIDPEVELAKLDNETYYEVMMCAEGVGESEWAEFETIKNDNPLGWLLYDLDYNVTNLLLAACKHNPQAPIILNHWMPQLVTYKRYQDVRSRNFEFSSEERDQADLEELERYYVNLGYDEIPTRTPKETGIIDFETEYDEDDTQMAAFENWMEEVYDEEGDLLYFDDEDFQPDNNVFDPDFGLEDTDETTRFKEEYQAFREEFEEEGDEYMDKIAKITNYTHQMDEEGQAEFRGHLVVACAGTDEDLDLAETITKRMKDEFGKKVFVETRIYNQALPEDNVYEIWLESYDIELLHSRRKAIYNANQWDGPADLDEKQLDYIVGKVNYLISDDARYSFHLHEFVSQV